MSNKTKALPQAPKPSIPEEQTSCIGVTSDGILLLQVSGPTTCGKFSTSPWIILVIVILIVARCINKYLTLNK